jgi:flagellar biosynthesis protein FliQ
MEPEIFVDILSDALFLVIKLVSAIVVPGLLVGLVVAVFQAATSINEQTLSFFTAIINYHWGTYCRWALAYSRANGLFYPPSVTHS